MKRILLAALVSLLCICPESAFGEIFTFTFNGQVTAFSGDMPPEGLAVGEDFSGTWVYDTEFEDFFSNGFQSHFISGVQDLDITGETFNFSDGQFYAPTFGPYGGTGQLTGSASEDGAGISGSYQYESGSPTAFVGSIDMDFLPPHGEEYTGFFTISELRLIGGMLEEDYTLSGTFTYETDFPIKPIPLPSAAWLLAFGLPAMLLNQRR